MVNDASSSAAHDILSSHGILHGDVSAGNILIDVDASYKANAATGEPEGIVSKDRDPQNASGFLSDWEFAWLPQHVLDVASINSPQSQPDSDQPDADMNITPGDILTVSTESLCLETSGITNMLV